MHNASGNSFAFHIFSPNQIKFSILAAAQFSLIFSSTLLKKLYFLCKRADAILEKSCFQNVAASNLDFLRS